MTFLESYSQDNKASWSVGIDTSTYSGSLCFFNSNEVLHEIHWGKEKRHSENLISDFYNEIDRLNLDLNNLKNIFLGIGPGSFTGIRVSCAFVKALSYSTKASIYSFNSLRILATQAASQSDSFTIATPSIASLVFSADYNKSRAQSFSEKISYNAQDLNELLNSGREVFMDSTFKDNLSAALQSKISFLDITKSSLFNTLDFSHISTLFMCYSTHLDLIPLYFRLSEAEEKYESKVRKNI